MATVTQEQKDMIDNAGRLVAALAGFMLVDKIWLDGAITPEFIKPIAGWVICIGGGLLASRLVHK
jgi:hypothetical protein